MAAASRFTIHEAQSGLGALTGPRTPTSVTSSTFSIGAWFGSAGGGRSSVERSSGAILVPETSGYHNDVSVMLQPAANMGWIWELGFFAAQQSQARILCRERRQVFLVAESLVRRPLSKH
jgi:hypothetical protein